MSEGHNTPESEKIPAFGAEVPNLQQIKTEVDFQNKNAAPPRLKPQSLNTPGSDPNQPSPTELFGIPITPLSGRYEFLTVIGAGGAGVIYKAKQKPLGRPVAVKMIHSHLVNVTALKRFLQEAKTISTMHHPNIISVHDFGVSEENQPYMVMDFVEGTTLSDMIKEGGALEPEFAVNLAMQICDGLAHAHSHNVLHRDLKPNNVMLVPLAAGEYHLRVLDFGLAKLFAEDEQADHLTKTGETVGTPAYMAPEQVMGKKLSPRSDVYSLGCLLYHCLTGFVPFGGATKMETMLKQLNDPAPPFSEYDVDVSERLEALVMQLLSKDPAGRPESMEQVKKQLKALLTETSSSQMSSLSKKEKKKEIKGSVDTKKIALVAVPSLIVSILGAGAAFYFLSPKQPTASLPSAQNAPLVAAPTKSEKQDQSAKTEANTTSQTSTAANQTKSEERVFEKELKDPDDRAFVKTAKSNLDATSIEGKQISDEALYILLKMKYLRTLVLSNSKSITDAGISVLAALPIAELYLESTGITDRSLNVISQLSKLRTLNISSTAVTNQNLASLANCPDLKVLDLSKTKLAASDLSQISSLKSLRELNLSHTKVNDKAMTSLTGMQDLNNLNLSNTAVGNAGMIQVSKLEHLTKLNLSNTQITAPGLAPLSKLRELADLDLSGVKLNPSAVDNLVKLKGLGHLHVANCNLSNSELDRLSEELYPGIIERY